MAWKAKTVSDLILPVKIVVNGSEFTVELRHLTPKHNTKLTEQCTMMVPDPDTGAMKKKLDEDAFSTLLFDAIVVRALDLTPAIVAEMLEFDVDSDPVPIDAEGHVVDRGFLKFLWQEAPARLFATQVIRHNDAMLRMAKLQREIDEGNSASSSAP